MSLLRADFSRVSERTRRAASRGAFLWFVSLCEQRNEHIKNHSLGYFLVTQAIHALRPAGETEAHPMFESMQNCYWTRKESTPRLLRYARNDSREKHLFFLSYILNIEERKTH